MGKCHRCKTEGELFNLMVHGRRLIGMSNAWISVWGRWKDDVHKSESSEQLHRDGCCGAASHLNGFIEGLIKANEE